MKKFALFLMLTAGFAMVSCDSDNEVPTEEYQVAVPLTMSVEEFRNSVDIISPLPVEKSGKIYAYQDYIFVNDKYRGVHVIDNRNPASPQKIAFIKIPGNVDIAVKDNYLYADSLRDLLVFDLSDINQINLANRLTDVLRDNVPWPFEADFVDYEGFGDGSEILIGWDLETRMMTEEEVAQNFGSLLDDVFIQEAAFSDTSTGQGAL